MQPNEITEILSRPTSRELLSHDLLRMAYVANDGMVRVVIIPTWVTLIDFETALPSAVEELVRQRAERQRA